MLTETEDKKMKWQARISEVGNDVPELMESTHVFDLVQDGRRNDMRDFTVHFSGELPEEPIKAGDTVNIGGAEMFVIAIGDKFNEHFIDHAACTVEISTGLVPQTPYSIILEGIYDGYGFLQNGALISVN